MTTDTQALNTATQIMGILHDAVLNPGPGGLVQVKARIQIAVRAALDNMCSLSDGKMPDLPGNATYDQLLERQGILAARNTELCNQNDHLSREGVDLRAIIERIRTALGADAGTMAVFFPAAITKLSGDLAEVRKENADLEQRNGELLAEHNRLAVENTALQGKLHDLQHDREHLAAMEDKSFDWIRAVREALGVEFGVHNDVMVETAKKLVADLHYQRAVNGDLAREASNYRQEAAANAQRRDEARAERDELQSKLDNTLRQRDAALDAVTETNEQAAEIENRILDIQQELGILRPSEDNPIADHGVILEALRHQRGRLTAEHQRALRDISVQWMPSAGQMVLNSWIANQPREQ